MSLRGAYIPKLRKIFSFGTHVPLPMEVEFGVEDSTPNFIIGACNVSPSWGKILIIAPE